MAVPEECGITVTGRMAAAPGVSRAYGMCSWRGLGGLGGLGESTASRLASRHKSPRFGSAVAAAVGAVAVGGVILGAAADRAELAAAGPGLLRALWILPVLVALHLGQLMLAAIAWRALFGGSSRTGRKPGIATFYPLRIIREGIDSLLPVAQVGGEIVGARLLARHGVPATRAAASVIVDVTIELLTQIVFLALGLSVLAWLSPAGSWGSFLRAAAAGVAIAAAFLLAQRFGLLRMLEALLRGMARRWPALSGVSLDGLHAAALGFYRRPGALLHAAWLHLIAWMLGAIETWAVLNLLGVPVTPLQAFVVESLGMAGRSAGFAIPAALGAQEGGFVLAAAAIGLPAAPALVLSLVKRLREVLVGSIGLALWRLQQRRTVPG